MQSTKVSVTLELEPYDIPHVLALVQLLANEDGDNWYEDGNEVHAVADCLIQLQELNLRADVREQLDIAIGSFVAKARELQRRGLHPWETGHKMPTEDNPK